MRDVIRHVGNQLKAMGQLRLESRHFVINFDMPNNYLCFGNIFHLAAMNGQVDAMRELINLGANPYAPLNNRRNYGDEHLYVTDVAAVSNHPEVLDFLVSECMFDIIPLETLSDTCIIQALEFACMSGSLRAMEFLIREYRNSIPDVSYIVFRFIISGLVGVTREEETAAKWLEVIKFARALGLNITELDPDTGKNILYIFIDNEKDNIDDNEVPMESVVAKLQKIKTILFTFKNEFGLSAMFAQKDADGKDVFDILVGLQHVLESDDELADLPAVGNFITELNQAFPEIEKSAQRQAATAQMRF